MNQDEISSKNEKIVIQDVVQLNKGLRKEIQNIRQQMKQTTQYIKDDETSRKLQQYKLKTMTYQHQLEECQKTIIQLRKTIYSMENQLEQLKMIDDHDHRFIHELFHLCLKYPSKSSPSHQDMKIYIQQTFNHLIKRMPSYQYCLDIVQEYQRLFDVKCFKQIPISLTNVYHKYGELKNFIHSVSSTIEVDEQDQKLVIETLEKIVEDSKADQMNMFKHLAKIKHMNEAMTKIHSYENCMPYYHQFIEQLITLLEVSKRDQIIPAVKTLKLLAHADTPFQWNHTLYD